MLLIIEEGTKSINDPRLFQKTFLDLKIPKSFLSKILSKHFPIVKGEFDKGKITFLQQQAPSETFENLALSIMRKNVF